MKASSLWMKKRTIADMDDERKKKKRKTEPEQTVSINSRSKHERLKRTLILIGQYEIH